MSIKTAIPAFIACAALCGATAAYSQDATSTLGAGAATAGNAGAIAGSVTAGKAPSMSSRSEEHRRMGRRDRERRTTAPANSTSTYGAGAVYTDRNSTSAGVTAGASASGDGLQSAGTSVGAYGETTPDGTSADMYGDAAASSGAQ